MRAVLEAVKQVGIAVIDDGYRVLGEYQNKTCLNPPKGVGDIFLKWLLPHSSSPRVELVALNEMTRDCFVEFPDPALEALFEAPDRKFAAVAPPIQTTSRSGK